MGMIVQPSRFAGGTPTPTPSPRQIVTRTGTALNATGARQYVGRSGQAVSEDQ